MIQKNRRKFRVNRALVPAQLITLGVMAVALIVGYLWLGNRCDALGKELLRLEAEKAELTKRYMYEENNWTRMKSPQNIEKSLAKHNLVMAWPRPDQIVRLSAEDFAFGRPVDSRDRLQGYAKLPGGYRE